MRKRITIILKRIIRALCATNNLKRLGYPGNTKLLIIHADDIGLSSSENAATFDAFKKGMVNSGSVMVNCAAFHEVADFIADKPGIDLGVHLTLTSEWESYKWRPVSPSMEVPGIIDQNGFLLESNAMIKEKVSYGNIEKEFRAQIIKAITSGIDITHLDSHMFTVFSDKKILEIYRSLGREYKLPVLLTKEVPVKTLVQKSEVIVDQLYYAEPKHYRNGLKGYYSSVLQSLRPGLNCILIHMAFDNHEMKQITGNQSGYGSAWRQEDYDYFTGEECSRLLKENNIHLITWREIRDKLIRY